MNFSYLTVFTWLKRQKAEEFTGTKTDNQSIRTVAQIKRGTFDGSTASRRDAHAELPRLQPLINLELGLIHRRECACSYTVPGLQDLGSRALAAVRTFVFDLEASRLMTAEDSQCECGECRRHNKSRQTHQ